MNTYDLGGYPGLKIDATGYKAVLLSAMQHYDRILSGDLTYTRFEEELRPFAARAVALIEGDHEQLEEARVKVFYLFLKHVVKGLN